MWSKSKVEWGIKNGFIVVKKAKIISGMCCKNYAKVDNEGNPIVRTRLTGITSVLKKPYLIYRPTTR